MPEFLQIVVEVKPLPQSHVLEVWLRVSCWKFPANPPSCGKLWVRQGMLPVNSYYHKFSLMRKFNFLAMTQLPQS